MMKISCCWLYAISKYGYPPSIDNTYKALNEMKNLGFRFVELEGVGFNNMEEVYKERVDLKKFCDDNGLKVINFCPILPELFSPDKSKRDEAMALFYKGLEIAGFFGTGTVQIDSFAPPVKFKGITPYSDSLQYGLTYQVEVDPLFDWEEHWKLIVDVYKRCSTAAKESNLRLTVEPRVGEIISNSDGFLRLYDHVADENLGIVLDTGHQHPQKEILPFSIEKLGKRIMYLHVSDNDCLTNEHKALGEGTIDWVGIFKALKKHNFDGYIAIDIGNVPDIDKRYTDSINYLRNLLQSLDIQYEI